MKLNILFLTQDDRMVLEFIGYTLEESLKDTSIGIFDTDDEQEAINIIDFNVIDLIIADMNINTIESYEFFDKLKADPKFDEIPFVFLSSNEDDQEIAILKGISNFFLKPLDVEQLLETLHNILSHSRKNNVISHLQEDFESETQEINNILDHINKAQELVDNDSKKDELKETLLKIKEEANKLLSIHSENSDTF